LRYRGLEAGLCVSLVLFKCNELLDETTGFSDEVGEEVDVLDLYVEHAGFPSLDVLGVCLDVYCKLYIAISLTDVIN
jgi:hypothetical protein